MNDLAKKLEELDIPTREALEAEQPLETSLPPIERPFAPTPIALLRTNTPPSSYMFHIHSQICSRCNSKHLWTEVFTLHNIEAAGRRFKHLRPLATDFAWNIPLEYTHLETQKVFACQECLNELSLSHLPVPEVKVILSGARDESKPTKGKTSRSLNDLLEDI